MTDDRDLEARVEALEAKLGELNRDRAMLVKALRELASSDDGDWDVVDLPSDMRGYRTRIQGQLDSHDTALKSHAGRLDDFEQQGATAGHARVEKIRRAMIRRAARTGKAMPKQAAQQQPVSLDYEDVLALFDYEIDRSYASSLIDKATTGDREGHSLFWVKKGQHRSERKKLKLDLSELPDDSAYARLYREERSNGSVNRETSSDACESATTREGGDGVE